MGSRIMFVENVATLAVPTLCEQSLSKSKDKDATIVLPEPNENVN